MADRPGTDGRGCDVVLEAASRWEAIQTSMEMSANNGAVVVVARHYDRPDWNPVGQVHSFREAFEGTGVTARVEAAPLN